MALDLFACMRSFVNIVEQGGFAAAARQLHISPPVLTKQIQWLERQVKKTLLERTTRRVELTPAGQLYWQEVQKILAAVQQSEQMLAGLSAEPSGTIVVGDSGFLNSRIFLQQMHAFLQSYPKVSIRLQTSYTPASVLEGSVDVMLSQDNLVESGLIKEHLFDVSRHIYAAPSYLKKHGTPKSIEDLQRHHCLIFEMLTPTHQWQLSQHKKVTVQGQYYSNSSRHFVLALLEGFGLGWCADYLVEEYVAAGQLQKVILEQKAIKMPVFLYYRPTSHNIALKQFVTVIRQAGLAHNLNRRVAAQ